MLVESIQFWLSLTLLVFMVKYDNKIHVAQKKRITKRTQTFETKSCIAVFSEIKEMTDTIYTSKLALTLEIQVVYHYIAFNAVIIISLLLLLF